jgi:poly-gamma-glutamate capsule biosynthesis protein CapA/YwtB (metallophosphatase superfamily)
MKKYVIVFTSLLLFGLISFFSYSFIQKKNDNFINKEPLVVQEHPYRENSIIEKNYEMSVTLGAIGDILIHDRVYNTAKKEIGYDFKPMIAQVKEMLQKPDVLLANQETLLGGVEIGLSSYPSFNSPQEVGDAFIDAGVDIVSTANNHTLDRGEKAILRQIDYFNRVGLPYVGSFKDKTDQQTLRIMNKNGIKLGYLSYTFGTNGIPVPKGKDYLVNLIDQENMKTEIHRAKKEADVVIMSIHWGNEYQRFPSDQQKFLAQFLVNEGVNIIFGHHPHVLQPMEWLKDQNGQPAFVVYSLGNFLSGQMGDYKDIGGLATIEITKQVTKSGVNIELKNPIFSPTYVSNQNSQNYQVVPLQNAGVVDSENAQSKYDEILNHMTQWLR